MENKKNKKPLRRRLLTFGLIAISVLSLGAFGITTFGNNDVVTASAYNYDGPIEVAPSCPDVKKQNSDVAPIIYVNPNTGKITVKIDSAGAVNMSTYFNKSPEAMSGLYTPSAGENYVVYASEQSTRYFVGIGRVTDPAYFTNGKTEQYQYLKMPSIFNQGISTPYGFEGFAHVPGVATDFSNISGFDSFYNPISLFEIGNLDTTYYYFTFTGVIRHIDAQTYKGATTWHIKAFYETIDGFSNYTAITGRELLEDYLKNTEVTNSATQKESFTKARQLLSSSYTESLSNISVEYIEMNGVNSYEKKTVSATVDSAFLYNENYVVNSVLKALGKTNADGAIDFTKFNATYTGKVFVNGVEKQLKDEIIRTAIGYDYTYDAINNTGKIAIKYSDYDYKDLYIEVKNNNIADNIVLNLGTTDAKMVGENIVLTWNISNIIKQINNTYEKPEDKQIYSLSTEEFKISFDGSEKAPEDFTLEEHGFTVTCTYTDESNKYLSTVALTFPSDSTKWENLFGLGLSTCAILVEDVELDAYLKYIEVNQDDFSYEWKEFKFDNKILYSEALLFTDNLPEEYSNFIYNNIGETSSQAHSFHYCVGMQPADVYIDEGKVVFTPIYNHVTGIKVVLYNVDTKQQTVSSYKPLLTSTVSYKAKYFSFNVPDGYRISNIRSYNENVSVDFNEKMPLDSTIQFYVSTAMDEIITIIADITDEWFLEVEYLAPYKDSAFSVLTTWTGTIKVSDYSVYELTQAQLETIMGVPTLNILNLATIQKTVADFIPVTLEEGSTVYKIKLKYTKASMRKTNADGSYDEIMVPLTSYSAWCDIYGKEWSILWLNSPDKKIFEFENDVDRDKLYGFFTMATFEQQISDLNSILSSYASNGCRTVYTSQTVKGSDIYKWFNRNKDKLGVGLISDIGIWGCELANADNVNAYSYFLYLDGTSDLNYVANNGADAYDDTDSAIDNKVEDVGDWFKDKANGIKNWFTGDSTVAKIIRIVLYVFAGFIGLLFIIWMVKKIIRAIRG